MIRLMGSNTVLKANLMKAIYSSYMRTQYLKKKKVWQSQKRKVKMKRNIIGGKAYYGGGQLITRL